MEKIQKLYRKRSKEIKARLREFETNKDIFQELCYCLLTPGTSAFRADSAIKELSERRLLSIGNERQISNVLKKKIRFHNTKAKNIVMARKNFKEISCNLEREWIVQNVKGLGWKEASHFLRNIGKGRNLAIIDRHILKNLKEFGFIDKVPETVSSRKQYLGYEERVREFSRKSGIPMEELDLLLWSKETGTVFK